MRTTPFREPAGVSFLAAILLVGSTAPSLALGQPPAPYPRSPAVVHQIASAAATCSDDPNCLARVVDLHTARLGARIEGMRRGPAGLSGWLRLAAELHGTLPKHMPNPEHRPLREAILALYDEVGLELTPMLAHEVASQTGRLSDRASREIADLVNALVLAARFTAEARSNSGIETLLADPARAVQLATFVGSAPPATVPDALRAEWQSVVRRLERVDLTKIVAAALMIAEAMADYDHVYGQDDLDLPLVFVGGAGNTTHDEEYIVLIDESGHDTYLDNAGGPLFLVPGPIGVAFGLARDIGRGNDHYRRGRMGQGFGLAGPGVLVDEGGRDVYELSHFGQGASVAGVGVLYDAGGEGDRYLSPLITDRTLEEPGNPIGTKAASLGGIGLLVDEGGADVFHQDKIDGLVWGAAGGLGLLASLGPEADLYLSRATTGGFLDRGTFLGPIQVSAEVSGAAILYEEGGDDRYECVGRVRQGCQAASGSDSLALLWDRGGNDTYSMDRSFSVDLVEEFLALRPPIEQPIFPMGQGASYASGVPSTGPSGLGLLYDESGNDLYRAEKWAQGYGTFGGLGVLYDGGGADRYETRAPLTGRREDGSTWVDGIVGVGIDR